MLEQEKVQMKLHIQRQEQEEEAKLVRKRLQAMELVREVKKANDEALQAKSRRKEAERKEDLKILRWQRKKARQEEAEKCSLILALWRATTTGLLDSRASSQARALAGVAGLLGLDSSDDDEEEEEEIPYGWERDPDGTGLIRSYRHRRFSEEED